MYKLARTLLAGFCLVTLCLLSGCQSGTGQVQPESQMIGVLITYEPLDLSDEVYLVSSQSNQIMTGDGGRNDGSANSSGSIDSIPFYLLPGPDIHALVAGDAISNVSMTNIEDKVKGQTSVSLEGTINVLADTNLTFYLNLAYQRADGSIYTQGSIDSVIAPMREGSDQVLSIWGPTDIPIYNDGKVVLLGVQLTVSVAARPIEYLVMQLNEHDNVLARNQYQPGELPDVLSPEIGTAYLRVETTRLDADGNSSVTREIIDQGQTSFTLPVARADGLVVYAGVSIEWSE